jgi:hypothetical protein
LRSGYWSSKDAKNLAAERHRQGGPQQECRSIRDHFDIIFKTREDYEAVKASGVITEQLISKLYDVPTQRIITFLYFDAANAIKATIPRPRPQGSIGEIDMHAAQQHVPLMHVQIPWPKREP